MTTLRGRVPRPPGRAYAFACTECLLVYRDGVDYATCVRCERGVDWIDDRWPVLVCQPCDVFANGPSRRTRCRHCDTPMVVLAGTTTRQAPGPLPSVRRMASYVLVAFLVVQTLFAVLDPDGFPYLAQLLVIAQLLGLAIVGLILFAAPQIRGLLHHRMRILHGLEHATAKVLAERGISVRNGETHDGQFLLVLDNDGRTWERLDEIRDAARDAIRRVIAGEHELAYHERCGTSYAVAICLYAIAIVGAGLGAYALGAPTGLVWAATVGAGVVVRAIARRTGLYVQRWLTVSTDLARGTVTGVQRGATSSGDYLQVVIAIDVEPRAREGGLVAPASVP